MEDIAVGTRFERIVVVGMPERRHRFLRYYPCRCDCGVEKMCYHNHLIRGEITSCGCKRREQFGDSNRTHGESYSALYQVWKGMRARCENPKNRHYRRYGRRGIQVTEEWQDYPTFAAWARSHGYSPALSIERIDTNGNYAPDNCTWADAKTQARNKCNRVLINAFGERKILVEWAEDPRCQVAMATLLKRLERGWKIERALTTPPQRRPHQVKAFEESSGAE